MPKLSVEWVAAQLLPWTLTQNPTPSVAIDSALDIAQRFLVAADTLNAATVAGTPAPVTTGPRPRLP